MLRPSSLPSVSLRGLRSSSSSFSFSSSSFSVAKKLPVGYENGTSRVHANATATSKRAYASAVTSAPPNRTSTPATALGASLNETSAAEPKKPARTSEKPKTPPTAVVMMNLGGPATLSKVYDFLHRLFSDPDLIPLPFQKYMAPWIARRRTPSIQEQYAKIGGGSPILEWTRKQGRALEKVLDETSPETAPHKTYVAFRYASPLTEDAVSEMLADGVTRAVAFTQYPQYSCSTTGSSMNELWRKCEAMDPKRSIRWSVIDRWHSHSGLVESFAKKIEEGLRSYPAEKRDDVVILFSAHSLPMSVVNRGDTYPAEVAATVHKIMERLNYKNSYRLLWQSQVGPSAWLGPQTGPSILGLGKRHDDMLLVPVAFTSDHIETLFELDQEYGGEAKEAGIKGLRRAESLNDDATFIRAMGDIVKKHLKSERVSESNQWKVRCPGCTTEACGQSRKYFLS